jgi:hypothetical protein
VLFEYRTTRTKYIRGHSIGHTITCKKFVENCHIVIGGRTLQVKLAVFSILGFDVILGMDWLSKYGANIDCRKNEVIF